MSKKSTLELFTAIFGPPLLMLGITSCVAVATLGVICYDTGSAIDLSAYFLNAWNGDWSWPGVPIAHRVIDATTGVLGLNTGSPVISLISSLYGAIFTVFINIFCVMLMLLIAMAFAHNVSKLLKWFWLRFK